MHKRIAVLPYPVNLIAKADTDPYRLRDCGLINQKSGFRILRDKDTGMMLTHVFAQHSFKGCKKCCGISRVQAFSEPGNFCQCSTLKGGFVEK